MNYLWVVRHHPQVTLANHSLGPPFYEKPQQQLWGSSVTPFASGTKHKES